MLRQAHANVKTLIRSPDLADQDSTERNADSTTTQRKSGQARLSDTSRGYAYAVSRAVRLHISLSTTATLLINLEVQKRAGQVDTLDIWAAVAKELPELTAAAAGPAVQLFAVACHYWHEQLTTEEELLTDSQQLQPQQQPAHSRGLRPLQASQLPRQPFRVKPQEVSAAHELLLQHLLGDAHTILTALGMHLAAMVHTRWQT
jgi:hypothetical protein